jgi:hypothetical protein
MIDETIGVMIDIPEESIEETTEEMTIEETVMRGAIEETTGVMIDTAEMIGVITTVEIGVMIVMIEEMTEETTLETSQIGMCFVLGDLYHYAECIGDSAVSEETKNSCGAILSKYTNLLWSIY